MENRYCWKQGKHRRFGKYSRHNTNLPLLFTAEAFYAQFLFGKPAFADLYLVNSQGSAPLCKVPVKPKEHHSLSLSSIK